MTTVFPPDLFRQSFMVHAFISSTIVAIVAAAVGFFIILRGSSFVAHALPKMGFAGAAGAVLLGISPVIGLAVFCVGGAFGIGWLGRRGRHDAVTALVLVAALGTGSLFLVLNNDYASGAYALLFGQIVGVSSAEMVETAWLGIISLCLIIILFRPLLFASMVKEVAQARGIPTAMIEMLFLTVVGLAAAVTVPVVGALLSFSLMIGPAATAAFWNHRPFQALAYSIGIAIFSVWCALILAYDTGWPVGFFVALVVSAFYGAARIRFRKRAFPHPG